jgi:predicted short-subunit dehydrogenase-like oxidoreductase (DUF2520 family)
VLNVPAEHSDLRPVVSLVGAGAVGTALARRLHQKHYPIGGVLSRTRSEAKALACQVDADLGSDRTSDMPESTRFLFICVPDQAVAEVARELASVKHPWSTTVVAHTSGALTADVLGPLAEQGATVLSFHPLQSFRPHQPILWDAIIIGIEGDDHAVACGEAMALGLKVRPVVIDTEAKGAYHMAASMASNFFATLVALVLEVLEEVGIEPDLGFEMIKPLIEGTWHNLQTTSPQDALTGPIVRGDLETVELHGTVLRYALPRFASVYVALAAETVRLAHQSNRLASEEAESMLEVLHNILSHSHRS